MNFGPLLFAFMLAGALTAGCAAAGPTADEKILQSWPHAEKRYTNQTDASHHASYAFQVTESLRHLQVEAAYRTNGHASFVLSDPQGNGAKIDTLGSAKTVSNAHWFDRDEPEAGTWHLSVDLATGGVYAFGIEL